MFLELQELDGVQALISVGLIVVSGVLLLLGLGLQLLHRWWTRG